MNQGIIQYSHASQEFTTYRQNQDGDTSPNNNIGWAF